MQYLAVWSSFVLCAYGVVSASDQFDPWAEDLPIDDWVKVVDERVEDIQADDGDEDVPIDDGDKDVPIDDGDEDLPADDWDEDVPIDDTPPCREDDGDCLDHDSAVPIEEDELISKRSPGITVDKTIAPPDQVEGQLCNCKGYEVKSGSGLSRPFKVVCKRCKPDKKGKKCGPTLDTWTQPPCRYKGDPHCCPKYNKNQVKFYTELLDLIAPDQCRQQMAAQCSSGREYLPKLCKGHDDATYTSDGKW